jgi:hypothetical protein
MQGSIFQDTSVGFRKTLPPTSSLPRLQDESELASFKRCIASGENLLGVIGLHNPFVDLTTAFIQFLTPSGRQNNFWF